MVEERIATLETKVEALEEIAKESRAILEEIKTTQIKQKSFLGGVVFVVSAMWGLFMLLIEVVFPTISKKFGL
jgi:hypothetical protein